MPHKVEKLDIPGYERVEYCEDPVSGLRAIISVHNTNLGPACGGVRVLKYNSRDEALEDVLRLSKGMSYKSALAGIAFGGGKSVFICDPKEKTPAMLKAFGEFLNTFGGTYIAAKDMNIEGKDLGVVKTVSKHVLGVDGEDGSSGDPSPVTAYGVLKALNATTEHLFGHSNLTGMQVAIQGLGHVGYRYAELVRKQGADLIVADVNPAVTAKAEAELGATVVGTDEIASVECTIFSPCARGGILNPKTIENLQCMAVVGAANNQLQSDQDGLRIHEMGILYVPDYAVNSGGIINIFVEHEGYDAQRAIRLTDKIYSTIHEILDRADAEKAPPFKVADRLAEERIRAGKRKEK